MHTGCDITRQVVVNIKMMESDVGSSQNLQKCVNEQAGKEEANVYGIYQVVLLHHHWSFPKIILSQITYDKFPFF